MGHFSKKMETRRLDAHLINDIWSWLQHELEGAVGGFLYPIIMSGRLSATEELKIRQLEPVSQMWRRDWNFQDTAPIGHEPIHRGDKWTYQQNQCPACILSRVGSDVDVLFALFAGMVGRFNTRSLTNAEVHGSRDAWEKTKSKRIRFVKYWLRTTRDGDAAVFTAGTFGMKMRRLRREWREEQQRVQYEEQVAFSTARPSLEAGSERTVVERKVTDPKIGPAPRPAEVKRHSPAGNLGFNIPSSPTDVVRQAVPVDVPVRRPVPPPPRVSSRPLAPSRPPTTNVTVRPPSHKPAQTHRPSYILGTEDLRPAPLRPHRPNPTTTTHPPVYAPIWDKPGRPNPPESQYAPSVSTLTDNRRQDSVMSSLLPPTFSRQPSSSHTAYPYSLASTRTITSYDGGGASYRETRLADPFDSLSIYSTPLGDEADDASTLPKPKRGSMYEAFGDGGWDGKRFERVDEEGEDEEWNGWEEEEEDGLDRVARLLGPKTEGEGTGGTVWEDLY
ncbi:hypothetical protein T440DRAFT_502113 [Plenodomus tracheiphilus IPT5]|uniref:Uncharacterized protein n=1 Tax=Plenodomus tracheiphilus IPT5 TaxID=1408161 RepID=A0A6A7AUR0_9PLEO|nr:hypothetical protein T440DRAFT_502113 [Plenodomus tracheiphilus IPT5]